MKKTFYLVIAIVAVISLGLGYPDKSNPLQFNTPFECKLSSTKTTYQLGELPELKVEIINNSGKEVYFIGSLDASDEKWRRPYCYYTIETPVGDSIPTYGRCKLMNPLRTEDFVKVSDGQSFNPFMSIDGQGFFGAGNVQNPDNFKNPGTYKIQFHYSTQSKNIQDYRGNPEDKELMKLFEQAPQVELSSNMVAIEIVK